MFALTLCTSEPKVCSEKAEHQAVLLHRSVCVRRDVRVSERMNIIERKRKREKIER